MGLSKTIRTLFAGWKDTQSEDNNIYLIYSMGKVGSSTVYHSLMVEKPESDVFHAHFLSRNYMEDIGPKLHKSFHRNMYHGKKILNHIKNNPGKRIKVITLTREPVSRVISGLFQNWKHIFEDIEEVTADKLKEYVESMNYKYKYTLEWFDREFNAFLDFDIYNHPFDRSRGYQIYEYGNYDILCIKVERLNDVSEEAFTEFLGDNIELRDVNTSDKKSNYDKYQYLKEHVKLDADRLTGIYNSKYVRHFYTQEEINDFQRKWTK